MDEFEIADGIAPESSLGNLFLKNTLKNSLYAMGNNIATSSPFGENSIFFTNTSIEYTATFDEYKNDLNKLSDDLKSNFKKNLSFIFNHKNYDGESVVPNTLTIPWLSENLEKVLDPSGFIHSFRYKNEDEIWSTSIFHKCRLNTRIGMLADDYGYRIQLDVKNRFSSFELSFYYANTKQFRKPAERTTSETDFILDDKYRAINIATPDPSAFIGFLNSSEIATEFLKRTLKSEFQNAFEEVKKKTDGQLDYAAINWYYQIVPNYILYEEKDYDLLFEHLVVLLKYDRDSFFHLFIDTGNAVVKVLRAITQDDKGVNFLYNKFNADQKLVKDIYEHLSKSGHSSEHNGQLVSHKTYFAALLLGICEQNSDSILGNTSDGSRDKSNIVFKIKQNYRVDSNIISDDTSGDTFDLTQQKKIRTIRKGLPVGSTDKFNPNPDEGVEIDETDWIDESETYLLHPMDMVMLVVEDETGNSVTFAAPAIFVKDLARQNEWEEVFAVIRLAVNILLIIVSAALLIGGAAGFLAVISIVDIGLASGDIVVQQFEKELMSTPEGRAFLEIWNSFYLSVGIVTGVVPIVGSLLVSGAKLLILIFEKGSEIVSRVIAMLKFAISKSTELAGKLIGEFTIIAKATGIWREFGWSLANKLAALQKEGVLLIKTELQVNGKPQITYQLIYNEKIIVEATELKNLENAINPFFSGKNGTGVVLKEALVSAAISLTTKNGQWYWTNAMGTKLRWTNLPQKTIISNIENAHKKFRDIDPGKFFEAEVAKQMIYLTRKFGDEITDFTNDVKILLTNEKNGDIDLATRRYFIESKINLSRESSIQGLYNQVQKYLPENSLTNAKYMNPLNKKVVVTYESLGNKSLNHPLLKELKDRGVIFVNGAHNLKKLY